MEKKIEITIIQASGIYYHTTIQDVVFPAYDGLRAVLYDHSPFVGLAGKGIIRIHKENDIYDFFYIRDGIIHVQKNTIHFLTEYIINGKDLNRQKIENELQKCEEKSISANYSFEQKSQDTQHLKYQLELLDFLEGISEPTHA